MIDLLNHLVNAFGVCGEESIIRKVLLDYLKDENVYTDKLGNVIWNKKSNKKNAEKIVLATNMDTSGISVNRILDNGLMNYNLIGIKDHFSVYNSKVVFENNTIGKIVSYSRQENKENFLRNSYIDIGSNNFKECIKNVSIGDLATYIPEIKVQKNLIIGNSLTRSCCSILIELIKKIKSIEKDLYIIFFTQGVWGYNNLQNILEKINADSVIILKTIVSDEEKLNNVRLGKGPVIGVIGSELYYDVDLKKKFITIAEKNKICNQLLVENINYNMYRINNKIFSESRVEEIFVPCRYKGESTEMIDINDLKNTIELLKNFVINNENNMF